ncbi:hypothetical protein ACSBR2_015413 [Camellia fascicularis]
MGVGGSIWGWVCVKECEWKKKTLDAEIRGRERQKEGEIERTYLGVEYIITDRIFETLPPDEQKLWHSHAYEIKSGLWVNPEVPELVVKPELENLTKTYGKFWCTWQVDRGDRLPLGPPSLMMSPQPVNLAKVRSHLVEKRACKYKISIDDLKMSRVEIEEPEWINPQADNWKQHGKGFVILVEPIEMKKMAPFP